LAHRRRRQGLRWLALVALMVPGSAHAQLDADKATARRLGQQGEAALQAGDWKLAEDDFRRGDALYHAPSLLLGLARAENRQGKVLESWENYHRIIEENVTTSPVFAKALADAKAEMPAVEARRSRLTITVTGSDVARTSLDGLPLKPESLGIERFTNPGPHTVTVTAPGFRSVTRPLEVAEGKAATMAIALERDTSLPPAIVPVGPPMGETAPAPTTEPVSPNPPRGRSLQWTLGVAALGLGGAAVVTGIVTGIMAVSDHSALSTPCRSGTCPASSQSELSSYHTVGAVSTIGFVVGGAALAGGMILILTGPKAKGVASATVPSLMLDVGLGTVGASGSF
jgi:hypothetical protein